MKIELRNLERDNFVSHSLSRCKTMCIPTLLPNIYFCQTFFDCEDKSMIWKLFLS